MTQEEKLKRLLDIFDPQTLTKEEFVKSFKNVVEFVARIEKKNIEDFKRLEKDILDLFDTHETQNNAKFADLSDSLTKTIDNTQNEIKSQITSKFREISAILEKASKDRIKYEKDLINKVLEQIPTPAEIVLDDAFEIRNKLETLNGDERISANAVAGLTEMIEEFKTQKFTSAKVGGGFSKIAMDSHIVDDETPTGTKNGINTDFKLAGAPNPISSLKVYVNGQRMRVTEDYTLSKKTITFLVAPATTDIILCDYRT